MYELDGDTRAQQTVLRREQQFREEWQALGARTSLIVETRDETLQRQYLEVFAAGDEVDALKFLADEIEARYPDLGSSTAAGCPKP